MRRRVNSVGATPWLHGCKTDRAHRLQALQPLLGQEACSSQADGRQDRHSIEAALKNANHREEDGCLYRKRGEVHVCGQWQLVAHMIYDKDQEARELERPCSSGHTYRTASAQRADDHRRVDEKRCAG